MGRIGRYEIHHHQDDDTSSSTAFITHGGRTIGNIPLGHMGKNIVTPEGPSIHPAHRGGKAKVKNLMPKVYAMIADKLGKTVESDLTQTKGSASVWARLAKMRKIKIAHKGTMKLINHPVAGLIDSRDYNHHRKVHNYYLKQHAAAQKQLGTAIRQNDRGAIRDINADIKDFKNRVTRHGEVYGIKFGEQMPKINSSSRINLNGQTYVPSKHEKTVYHPQIGDRFRLRLTPKRKK